MYGQADPDYSQVSYIPGDPGGITYVAANASLRGSLGEVLKTYIAAPGATFSAELARYIDRVNAKDSSLNLDEGFKQVLRRAGSDPVMQRVQESTFQSQYFAPALRAAQSLGIRTPLGIAVVYDSFVHGSLARVRDRTNAEVGGSPASGVDERRWVRAFLRARLNWLSTSQSAMLRGTALRPTALLKLADDENWDLKPPIRIADVDLKR